MVDEPPLGSLPTDDWIPDDPKVFIKQSELEKLIAASEKMQQ